MLRELFGFNSERESHQKPEMTQSDLLKGIADSLPCIHPNYRLLIDTFENTPNFSTIRLDTNRTLSRLMEIQLNLSLQEIIEISREDHRIQLNPYIQNTSNFNFDTDPWGGSRILNRISKMYEGEMDGLLVVDGKPAVFEAKLTSYYEGMKPQKKIDIEKNFIWPMSSQRIQKIARPLQEAFQTDDLGFVFVFPYGTAMDNVQTDFIKRGGLVTYMPFSKPEFQHNIYSVRPSYQYPNRDGEIQANEI